jgi:hypothetical protein
MFQDVDVFSISISGESSDSRKAAKNVQTDQLLYTDQETSTLKAVHSVEVVVAVSVDPGGPERRDFDAGAEGRGVRLGRAGGVPAEPVQVPDQRLERIEAHADE